MQNALLRKTFSLAACLLITGLALGSASGQATPGTKAPFEKPTFDDILSPEFMTGGGKQKRFKPKDWLEIEIKLNFAGDGSRSKGKTIEKLTVKWYVAVKNPDKPGTMLLLTKDVEHINVPTEEDIYCSVYLAPVSIKRLTGFDRAGKNAVEAVGYEILVNGEKIGAETTKFKVGWWNAASEKISRSEAVPLLSKSETPFRAMWWDRYAEVNEAHGAR
ncbi:MAG: Amuc_1102 family pilus-like protein [Verrucomicrobiota bacterium]